MSWREWQERRAERKRSRAIARIRCECAFWGHDLSELSDDEVEAGVMRLGKVVASAGLTVAEACEGIWAMNRALAAG